MLDRIFEWFLTLGGKIIEKITPRYYPWYERSRSELLRIARFVVVGVTSLVLYSGLYALFSRVIWREANHTWLNFLATVLSAIFNYFSNRHWTFKAGESRITHLRHIRRYVVVMAFASLLQSGLFWLGHEFFHLYDFFVIYPVALLIAFFTYTAHRVYTFKASDKSQVTSNK